ncbi:MAG: LamG-like jellyroll fold domain-containing protein [Pseudomonadota bacterium]
MSADGHPLRLHWTFDSQNTLDSSENNQAVDRQNLTYELLSEENYVVSLADTLILNEPKNMSLVESFSVAFWLKTSGTQNGLLTIDTTTGAQLILHKQAHDFVVEFILSDSTLSASVPVPSEEWMHIAIVHHQNLSCNNISLFVNGESTSNESPRACMNDDFAMSQLQFQTTSELTQLDEVRFYQLALTDDEISCLAKRESLCVVASLKGVQGSSGEEALDAMDISELKGKTGESVAGADGHLPLEAVVSNNTLRIGEFNVGPITAVPSEVDPKMGKNGTSIVSTVSNGNTMTLSLNDDNRDINLSGVNGVAEDVEYTLNGTVITDEDLRQILARGINAKIITTTENGDENNFEEIKVTLNNFGETKDGETITIHVKGATPERYIQTLTGITYGANGNENYITRATLGDAPEGQSYLHYIPIMVGGVMVVLPPRADADNLLLEFSNGDIVDLGDIKGRDAEPATDFDSLWSFSNSTSTVTNGTQVTKGANCEIYWNEIAPQNNDAVDVTYDEASSTIRISPEEYDVPTTYYRCNYCLRPTNGSNSCTLQKGDTTYTTLESCQQTSLLCNVNYPEPEFIGVCQNESGTRKVKYETSIAQFCSQ